MESSIIFRVYTFIFSECEKILCIETQLTPAQSHLPDEQPRQMPVKSKVGHFQIISTFHFIIEKLLIVSIFLSPSAKFRNIRNVSGLPPTIQIVSQSIHIGGKHIAGGSITRALDPVARHKSEKFPEILI